jgi:phosphatidylinositol glycan class V
MSPLLIAISYRFWLLFVALCSAFFGREYDSSTTLKYPESMMDWMGYFLHSLARWDSIYFLHIAKEEYVYEQEYAFFPGLPYLIRYSSLISNHVLL